MASRGQMSGRRRSYDPQSDKSDARMLKISGANTPLLDIMALLRPRVLRQALAWPLIGLSRRSDGLK